MMTGVPGMSTYAIAADAASILEEPMQPIAKDSPKIRVCKACSLTEMQDGSSQRVAERAAPEYSAPRDAGQMMMPRDDGAGSATDPYAGTTISVPGAATLMLPVVIQ
ncbi:hypothetical protein [Panacagrimonas perspica]|nr:hypothetical protein [Panacagrimonas perspica]